MENHEKHQQALVDSFAEIIAGENSISQAKAFIEQVITAQNRIIREAEIVIASAWEKIAGLLAETGEFSVVLPGAVTDYEIYRTSARESVKVADPSAVPDSFCKIERKPKLKEIGDYLRAQGRANLPLPNWASLELGESKLTWKAIKKKG